MRHRSVADLMTPNAVAVQRGTQFREIARLLDEFDITAVPVVDENDRPVGVVSEADLLRRHTAKNGPSTADALMTSPAVVGRPEWSAVRAARSMQEKNIKRLPVVDDSGRLIGVISRSDLVRLFLRRDRAIQEEILEEVLTRTLGVPPSAVTVDVADGTVTLSGTLERRSLVTIAVRLCESVDGVVEVVDRLGYAQDDAAPRRRQAAERPPNAADLPPERGGAAADPPPGDDRHRTSGMVQSGERDGARTHRRTARNDGR